MSWALVTGGSSRGGAAICRAFHAAGVDVIVHHSLASRDKAQSLHDDLCAVRPGSTRLWEADLCAAVVVPTWLLDLAPQHCVCNASTYRPSTLGDAERAAQDWAIHVAAHAAVLSALKPTLRSVTGISDIHVDRPARGFVWYTVSKSALQTMILSLAVDWAPEVRCNMVAPGTLPFPEDWHDEQRRRAIEQSVPLGRIGEFSELANAVRWLALDATYVTGHVLVVDGGRSRWLP